MYNEAMKLCAVQNVSFNRKPNNYARIDESVSRSAQPQREDFRWLKEQGVTDIFNFRTMHVAGVDFDEGAEVEKLGMRYHNIPSHTRHPNEQNIDRFLKEVDEVKSNGGKAHIHCKAGADRTGMYAFIYKAKEGIGNTLENVREWLDHGHNQKLYPDLEGWTKKFVNQRFGK